jgi:hypothetical protein
MVRRERASRHRHDRYRFKTGIQVRAGPTRLAIGVMEPASKLAGFGTVDVMAK